MDYSTYLDAKTSCEYQWNARWRDEYCACTETCGGFVDPFTGELLPECVMPPPSPIVVSLVDGDIRLTSALDGVRFDIDGDTATEQMSWTADGSTGLLVLDRNGDGQITSGKELFGNFTEQPPTQIRNGFNALSLLDLEGFGGNADGVLDYRDPMFSRLRIWADYNHNGVSEPSELLTLAEVGITSISLDYFESRRTDEFGNSFRYRARIGRNKGSKVGEWAYDVFFVLR